MTDRINIRFAAKSRMKNDDVDSEVISKFLKSDWIPESYVPTKDIRDNMIQLSLLIF